MIEMPFEQQLEPRSCGAAALCMVYRSLGVACEQSEVHLSVTRKGQTNARTHLLACDALRRGLSALILQARSPFAILQRAQVHTSPVILNHRFQAEDLAGHYSVLVKIDSEAIILHDPLLGPGRVLPWEDFQRLWMPVWGVAETPGQVLLAISEQSRDRKTGEELSCSYCQTLLPLSRTCRRCREKVPLQPGTILGCVHDECPGRLWARVFCPWCDQSFF
jgi:ABC-type bacteriocin/lantibiotic exporter with double-glycine peptidase domain